MAPGFYIAGYEQPSRSVPVAQPIIPADRTVLWQPGVTYNTVPGQSSLGIPNRTTVYTTLTPLGGASDDTPQIQTAVDNCPAGQVVLLSAGTFNINGNTGVNITTSNITLRGAGGPGPGSAIASGTTAGPSATGSGTYLWKADNGTNSFGGIIRINGTAVSSVSGTSFNLAIDALKGSRSVTLVSSPSGFSVGDLVLLDQLTVAGGTINSINPDVSTQPTLVNENTGFVGAGPSALSFFSRLDRTICQMMRVTAINGNVVSFETQVHYPLTVAYQAQLTPYTSPSVVGVGIENLYCYGGRGGDFSGNITLELAQYCWVKNCECHYVGGTSVAFYSTYRCEMRDCYIHEAYVATPGGGAYLTGMNQGTADSLFENNIMWNGDKVCVMRATGGGNVIAYNYMDDPYVFTFPQGPEAGVNACHYTTPQYELIEGNWSHSYVHDSFWGNSIYLTVFRNWLTGLRSARAAPATGSPNLATYTYFTGGVTYPYGDYWGRYAIYIQAHAFYHNIVGNVIGFSGQPLLSYNSGGFVNTQTTFVYENITVNGDGGHQWATMYYIGEAAGSNGGFDPTTYKTLLRQGNWDWVNAAQTWWKNPIGASGYPGDGVSQVMPRSLYLISKPSFFGSNPWPWVDPATGTTYTLPAKARFDNGTPNTVL